MNLRTIASKIWNFPLLRVLLFFLCIPLFAAAFNFLLMVLMLPFFTAWKINYLRIAPWFANTLSVVAAYIFMLRIVDKRKAVQLPFVLDGIIPETAIGFVIGSTIISLVIGCAAILGCYRIVGPNNYSDLVVPLIFLYFASASEEIICRGYVFQRLERSWGTAIAIVIASIVFGFSHMIGTSQIPLTERLLACACLVIESGLLYNAAYLYRRRLWLPIGIHWAWNYLQGPIYGMPVSGLVYWIPMIKAKATGAAMITGGSWGPEAGLPSFVIRTFIGVFFIIVAYRQGMFISMRQAKAAEAAEFAAVEELAEVA